MAMSKKEIIKRLARNLEVSINNRDPVVLNQIKLVRAEITPKAISRLIKRIRDKNKWTISDTWIADCLPQKYKFVEASVSQESPIVRLSDNYLLEHAEEIRDRYKDLNKGPARDMIKKETNKDDFEKYTWSCFFAQELAKLAINMEKQHSDTHDQKLCQEYAKRVKSTRDRRFATSINNYETIILAAHASTSLKNAISGEWQFLSRWEIEDNEHNCKECLGHTECVREKCKCVCHRTTIPMTTKGLKYAIKTNEYLKDWDHQMNKLTTMDNDICRMGKVLLEYEKTKKFLSPIDRERLMFQHIEKAECMQCEIFMDKNKNFFKKEVI